MTFAFFLFTLDFQGALSGMDAVRQGAYHDGNPNYEVTMENVPSNTALNAPPRSWPLFLSGVLLFVLGPAIYFVQISLGHLDMPWHLPVLAAVGVLFMAASVLQRRGVWRSVGLVLFALICGLEWYLVLVAGKTPPYDGPAKVGYKVPEFAATYADGRAFTNKDLEDGKPTVLLFYRGHW
jgi:hypothetical protein